LSYHRRIGGKEFPVSIVKRLFAVLVVALLVVSVRPRITHAAPGQNFQPAIPVTLKLTVVISRFNWREEGGQSAVLIMAVSGSAPTATESRPSCRPARECRCRRQRSPGGADDAPDVLQLSAVRDEHQRVRSGHRREHVQRGPDGDRFSVAQRLARAGQYAQGVRLPRYQSFTSSNRLILRDGQTVQYTAATDKTSGEVIKLDVT
jgi:hypothetical protein